jgi:hypothetical protein
VSDNRKAVSAAIKKRMSELRMRQDQLSRLTALSSPAIRQILNQPEKHHPTRTTLKLISEALGWPSNYLENVLNGCPQEKTAGQIIDDETRLSGLESKMSTEEQRLHKLIVALDLRLGNIAGVIYETGSETDIPNEVMHDRSDP